MNKALLLLVVTCLPACASTREVTARQRLSEREGANGTRNNTASENQQSRLPFSPTGTLTGYTAHAIGKNPRLHAAFQRWRGSVLSISRARRLPDPQLSFGVFLRSVETRVGPQRARVSLSQAFPWPTRLTRGADAMSAEADAFEQQLNAETLAVAQRVADAYWRLWWIRESRAVHEQHLEVLRGLSETVLARVAVGQATLAQTQQIALASARTEDMLRALDEQERSTSAALAAEIGEPQLKRLPTTDAPPPTALPALSDEALHASAAQHPLAKAEELRAVGQQHRASAERAAGYPSFGIGADWVIVGDSEMTPQPADSGKDAVMVGASVSLPLWQGNYSDSAEAARAAGLEYRAKARSLTDLAHARVEDTLSKLRDAHRREALYENTLIPQADAALSSALGAFVSGRGAVADTLLLQKDLLELRLERVRARADHARAWAQLEELTGRAIDAQEAQASQTDHPLEVVPPPQVPAAPPEPSPTSVEASPKETP